MVESRKSRRFWGWGYEDVTAPQDVLTMAKAGLSALLGAENLERRAPPRLDDLNLRPSRITAPAKWKDWITDAKDERVHHSYGKSYRDLIRAVDRQYPNPPDLVATPSTEAQIQPLLEHCAEQCIAVIPFGGGSSVCGGVEPAIGNRYRGSLSLDMRKLRRVLEVDDKSRSARIEAGVFGPDMEAQLKPHGLSLRHYPQSFEFSTLGGWIATRAGGHFATLYTHIDELVQSMRVITSSGALETRRLPGSGAGPDPNRMFCGSEGSLGIITEAWMRLTPRPLFRVSTSIKFERFSDGLAALRALTQSGLYPQNARLLDPLEAQLNGAGSGESVLVLGFESADHSIDAWIARAVECCLDHGGAAPDKIRARGPGDESGRDAAEQSWRQAFLRAPYLRDELVLMGIFVETYETATTWDRVIPLIDAVGTAAREVGEDHRIASAPEAALVTCRITHGYPDGCAPYFTVIAPARSGAELGQWDAFKKAITDAILENGGTSTHHHAVGRDTRPYYERERPALYAHALEAAKRALDPSWTLNPGTLLREPG